MSGDGKSVLALKPSSLGDIVHTLPAIARLKAARPGWRIAWLVNTEWAPLLEGNPDLDAVVPFPRREFRGPASWPRLARWVGKLRARGRPDLAVDFQGLLRSALLARGSGARRVVGAGDAREGARWLYDRAAPALRGAAHAVERSLALADDVLGEAARGPLRFPLPEGALPARGEGLGDFVLLHPYSRGLGKSLAPGQVEALCRELAPRSVVLVGRFEGGQPGAMRNVLDLLNETSLPELIGLIRRAAFVITVDSGPMHLAAALGRPLVGIHTWTDPRRVGPYHPEAWVWKGGRLFQMRDRGEMPEGLLAGVGGLPQAGDLRSIAARSAQINPA